jgi:hypothetical protein
LNSRAIPSIVWVIAALVGIVALVALISGAFFGFTQIEGLGSIALLVIAWVVLRVLARGQTSKPTRKNDPARSIAVAFGILTFAFAGFGLDQPGNIIYNLPIQWLFCPAGTQLQRGADVRNPRPGTTVITQNFTCVDADGQVEVEVPVFGAMIVRFVEYILLGYLLLWLSQLYTRFRSSTQSKEETIPG